MMRIDQELAAAAARALPPTVDSALRTRIRGLPASLQASGLAATCAFLLSKTDKPTYQKVAAELLTDACAHAGLPTPASRKDLLPALLAATPHQYLIAETRAKMFAVWLARIADARRGVEPRPEPTSSGRVAYGNEQ